MHLEQLTKLSAIAAKITSGGLEACEARGHIEQVMRAPARWGRMATVLAYVLSAGAFAVFFRGDMAEVTTATFVGLAVGTLSVAAQQLRMTRILFELIAAAVAAVIANVAAAMTGSFADWIPLASGLIILLPGLSLVDSIEELAHGHLTSGSARLAGVGAVLLAMAFGALLGLVVIDATLADQGTAHSAGLGIGYVVLALVAVSIGSTIRFRGRAVDVWVALAASTVALLGSRMGRGLARTIRRAISGCFSAGCVGQWIRPNLGAASSTVHGSRIGDARAGLFRRSQHVGPVEPEHDARRGNRLSDVSGRDGSGDWPADRQFDVPPTRRGNLTFRVAIRQRSRGPAAIVSTSRLVSSIISSVFCGATRNSGSFNLPSIGQPRTSIVPISHTP